MRFWDIAIICTLGILSRSVIEWWKPDWILSMDIIALTIMAIGTITLTIIYFGG